MPSIDPTRRTALYRLFDANDALLYAGIAFDPKARWLDHRRDKPWWPEVHRKQVDWFPSRERAAAVETEVIATERPLYNKQGATMIAPRIEVEPGATNVATLAMVRTNLRDIIDLARDQETPTAVTQRRRPRAFVVSVPFFERAERDAALIELLRAQNPELLDELSTGLVSISVPSRLSAAG